MKSRSVHAHAQHVLLGRTDPFTPAPAFLRLKDPTRFLPPDSRRAVVDLAHRVGQRFVTPRYEPRDLPMEAEYANRPKIDVCVGADVAPEAEDDRKGVWSWSDTDGIESFYARYPFLRPDSPVIEHFAERLFLEQILRPVLGDRGLTRVEAQVPFRDERGVAREIDFVLHGARDYAIEIEGAASHHGPYIGQRKFDDEKLRQRSIGAADYVYTPFTFSQLKNGDALRSFGLLCDNDDDPILMALGRLRVTKPNALRQAAVDLLQRMPVTIQQLHHLALAELAETDEPELHLRVEHDPHGIVVLAFGDVLTLLRATAALRGEEPPATRVRLSYPSGLDRDQSMLPAYFANPRWVDDRRDLRLDALPSESLVIDDSHEGRAFSLDRLEAHGLRLATMRAELRSEFGYEPPNAIPKAALDTFARWFFPEIAALHPQQAQVMDDVLHGRSKMVVLPTAYGKSVCFQLPALLHPGMLVVICPLRALMQDQIESLRANGIAAAATLSAIDDAMEKEAKLKRVSRGEVRLLYVSPERILVHSFVDEVARNAAKWGTWALAVDEAHCVSEWGHDFRPAYLYIDRFRRRLSEHRPVALLALTATASLLVREDVLQVLDIPGPVAQTKSSDRDEISFSVHVAEGSGGREAMLVDVVGQQLPQVLRRSPDELFRNTDRPQAVVVFAPYANPHGTHTSSLGVLGAARALINGGVLADEECRVHASQTITVCPNCSGQLYKGKGPGGNAPFECTECEETFDEPSPIHDGKWLDVMSYTQDRFKANEFPVLVATKGYGMGIDKRNIRGIVHLSFAAGLEGYYQEVGRAARDRDHGHAALIYAAPTEDCVNEHVRAADAAGADFLEKIEPPCVSVKRNLMFWKCPYGLASPCDFGLQARFIKGSYPGVDEDLKTTMQIFDKMEQSGEPVVDWYMSVDDERAGRQVSVYRLIQIGYVSEYSIEYRSYPRATMKIVRAPGWDFELATASARGYLRRLVIGQNRDAEYPQIDAQLLELSGSAGREKVESLIRLLLERTYRQVKGMRYRMLYNQWRFATDGAGYGCRRQYVREVFDGLALTENAACGFCDGPNCQPDLHFQRTRARVPVTDATLLQLSARIPELIERFEPDVITEAVGVAAEHNALASLQARAEHLLEVTPDNQSALLLAGEAARRRGANEDALARLGEASAVNERTTRDRERSRMYYERARSVAAAPALDLLDRSGGTFDDAEGHAYLLDEMRKSLPKADERLTTMEEIVACDDLMQSLPPALLASATHEVGALLADF